MEITGKNALILGGAGLVGHAVCNRLLAHRPARIVVAARRQAKARQAVEALRQAHPDTETELLPTWGDIFIRADWQDGEAGRAAALAEADKRRRLIDDVLAPLDDDILAASLLARLIFGQHSQAGGAPADIVVDCINTATAVSYQNLYRLAQELADLSRARPDDDAWPEAAEALLAGLYIPQLVRHVQILYEAMRRAGTRAYIKVGTSGTGGMGFNIPFTHGEERPSRMLLSKAAVAGAQSLLTFLMARTPDGPEIVKEIKPAALIGWREIGHGPIRRGGRAIALYDCPPQEAVSVTEPSNLAPQGDFGSATGEDLEGVYIDTGENGVFSAAEFWTITAPGQMQMVTAEEIARNVVREIAGGNTGRDVVAALDATVMGPTYRGGHLRQAARELLTRLEAEHGEAVAFEILGPPRLSKLLFEAHLLSRVAKTLSAAEAAEPEALARQLEKEIADDGDLRRRILSIGVPILLADGERLLRGPVVKSADAEHGWIDLRPENMARWQARLGRIRHDIAAELAGDTSSRHDRAHGASQRWTGDDGFDIGEIAAWIFAEEEGGRRDKG
ncbi:MAG: short-chain dehydrogenase [Alphaproteobacteria bacterium]|jgi:NAD(P)-dependent dehydrogenase (short-subunit alcohol dehydrogenase family)|nr:short-chain dehydrogenase [Alphaproteobacteria bacterium]